MVTTVRSEEKAKRILETYAGNKNLQVVIVPDVAEDHAFDDVAKIPGLEVVMHTASPFHFKWSPSFRPNDENKLTRTNPAICRGSAKRAS